MDRLKALLEHPDFQSNLALTAQEEEGREYCRHDLNHLFDVARIAYILYLQGRVALPPGTDPGGEGAREMIYAAALVHDIGRWCQYRDKTKDHAKESVLLAGPLLASAGFDQRETALILAAVAGHRDPQATGWDGMLYTADKVSRRCRDCLMQDRCRKPGEIGQLYHWIY